MSNEPINLFDPEIFTEYQAQVVVYTTSVRIPIFGAHFLVCPDPTNPRRHLWLLERESTEDIPEAASLIDQALSSLSPGYAAVRAKDDGLLEPRVLLLDAKDFNDYITAGMKLDDSFKFRWVVESLETLQALQNEPGFSTLATRALTDS